VVWGQSRNKVIKTPPSFQQTNQAW
jgi:hypothetical protein